MAEAPSLSPGTVDGQRSSLERLSDQRGSTHDFGLVNELSHEAALLAEAMV
jgi:hypothetical protein